MNEIVSIIMPSYNTASYITESIKSIQNQTYHQWELIIIDDCSTDDTETVVKPFLKDKRIKYLKNETNRGAAVSRNYGLRETKGRWIAFLDSDDLWEPIKLEKQISFMKNNGYSFSYTAYKEIDENSKDTGFYVTGPKRITKKKMENYCYPGCLTVMYDKKTMGEIQIADIKKNNDYAIWLKCSEKADCFLLDCVLASYRKRKGSISRQSYIKLIKWHFKLWHETQRKSIVKSLWITGKNIFYGVIKKIIYVKKKEIV